MTYGTCISGLESSIEPGATVLAEDLWLPKGVVHPQRLKDSLQVFLPNSRSTMTLWKETSHHLIVPRQTFPHSKLSNMQDRRPACLPCQFLSRVKWRDRTQNDAYEAMARSDGGILNLICGKGKTVLALHHIAQRKVPALVVVHTKDLQRQWIDEAQKHLHIPGNIGVIQGPNADWKHPLVIAMMQTLSSKADEWPDAMRRYFGTIIYDEVHHLSAPTFNHTVSLFPGSRWGLSATPKRSDGLEYIYKWHIGDILYSDTTPDLIPQIYFILTDIWPPKEVSIDKSGQPNITKLQQWLGVHEQRNKLIASIIKDAVKKGRNILVLSHCVEQLGILQKMVGTGGVCHGDIKIDQRREVFKRDSLVFATLHLAREALDKPELDCIIFVTPFSDEGWITQGMGRGQRAMKGKKQPIMIFMEDEGNQAQKQARGVKMALHDLNYNFEVTRWKQP